MNTLKKIAMVAAVLMAGVLYSAEVATDKVEGKGGCNMEMQGCNKDASTAKGKCGMGMKGKGMGNGRCMQVRKGQDASKSKEGCKDCKKEVKE